MILNSFIHWILYMHGLETNNISQNRWSSESEEGGLALPPDFLLIKTIAL